MANVLEGTEAWTMRDGKEVVSLVVMRSKPVGNGGKRSMVQMCWRGGGCESRETVGMHTFGGGEVNDVTVFLEHVDFLDLRNGLHIEFLECRLQFLIVGT